MAKDEALGQSVSNMLPESPSKFALIKVTRKENPLGGEPSLAFEWEGSPHSPVEIRWNDIDLIKHPAFPFKLKMIGRDVVSGISFYVRTDVPVNLRLMQFLETRWLKHCKAFNYFQMRIIMTLHIWGLAYVDNCEYPSWSCVGKRR